MGATQKTITRKGFEQMIAPLGRGLWAGKTYILEECPFCKEEFSFQFAGATGVWRCVSCNEIGDSFATLSQRLKIRFVPIDGSIDKPSVPDGLIIVSEYQTPSTFNVIDSGILELDQTIGGFTEGTLTVLSGKQQEGKCLAKGTKVIAYDGSLVNVEDVRVGDLLMGVDSKPRKVLNVSKGYGDMFMVRQKRGMDYAVNERHVLCLERGLEKIEMPVSEFIRMNKTWQSKVRGYMRGVSFPEKKVSVDPYFLGVWLGDGTRVETTITTPEPEISEYLREYATRLNQRVSLRAIAGKAEALQIVSERGKHNADCLLSLLRGYGLLGNKHIPKDYLINSEKIRLEVLAGIIDADATINTKGYDIVQKSEQLSKDIQYLANSLGFRCKFRKCRKTCCNNGVVGTYYRANITGDVWRIPCRVERKKMPMFSMSRDHKQTGITVKSIGMGTYYGFEIDGDHMFLLEDFTVTHNSTISGQLALNALNQDKSVCFYSGELTVPAFRRWIYSQAAGPEFCEPYQDKYGKTRFKASQLADELITRWIGQRLLLYDNSVSGSSETTSIIRLFKEASRLYGCDLFFVDNLMTVRQDSSSEKAIMASESRFVGDLIDFAQQNRAHVILVAHPRKGEEGDLNDRVSGTGAITRRASNVMFIERLTIDAHRKMLADGEISSPTTTNILHVSKNREYGDMTDIELQYDKKSRRLVPSLDPVHIKYGWEEYL